MTPVRLEPAALRSRVKHSTTEPLRSIMKQIVCKVLNKFHSEKYLVAYVLNYIEQSQLKNAVTWGIR